MGSRSGRKKRTADIYGVRAVRQTKKDEINGVTVIRSSFKFEKYKKKNINRKKKAPISGGFVDLVILFKFL